MQKSGSGGCVGGGGGGGGASSAPNNRTPWYQNTCITSALGQGALSVGIDALSFLPKAGGIARVIDHQSDTLEW